MTTLPVDNAMNVDELPDTRAPLIIGHESFDTVTAEICRVNEAKKPPRAWYIAMAMSVSLLALLGDDRLHGLHALLTLRLDRGQKHQAGTEPTLRRQLHVQIFLSHFT